MVLEHIEGPADVKKVSSQELKQLCSEVRQTILKKLSEHGGHVGPNLGMVEATVALHYVFNSPKDAIVFDVSHQCYAHKVLTGRKNGFLDPEQFDAISGYTNPHESKHDRFTVGHTSTAVSLACGLMKARDLQGEKHNIIAILGDGSLSGGEAFEGLNNVAELGTNGIIIFNDNQMSIAENHGGVYQNLQALRESNGQCPCNFFKSMGFDYRYVADGNDVHALVAAFSEIKNIDHPVVVHINTVKGKGLPIAEQDKETWHCCGIPFDLKTGKSAAQLTENYADLTAEYLLQAMQQNPKLVAITSGTPTVFGFTPKRRRQAGSQFVDVGITEEHAVAMASGIAAGGGRPVWGVFSTFVQRVYDQLSQDLCINNNPAVILVFAGTLNGFRDITHLGFFDIPVIANIPNMVYLAPTCQEEYFSVLAWSIRQTAHPVAIRVPANGVISDTNQPIAENYDHLNQYAITRSGSEVAILALGSFYQLGETVAALLYKKTGIGATLINPRFITGLDVNVLEQLKQNHRLVVTLEDGVLDGGFGEKIARFYGTSDMKVLNCGAPKAFVDRYDPEIFFKQCRLTPPQIVEDVQRILGEIV